MEQQIDHRAVELHNRVCTRTLSEVFLEAPLEPREELAPLTPFMIHVWRQQGLQNDATLHRAKDREGFVYSFYDRFHQTCAPHHIISAPNTLAWLNQPALDVSSEFETSGDAIRGQRYYLTRYMLHLWRLVRPDLDVFQPESYERFLVWFALERIPGWNLPPALLPDDLLPVMNRAVRPGLPMSRAMQLVGELRDLPQIRELPSAPDELLVALSFELMPDLLRAGDPRLVPDFVSRFWSKRSSSSAESLASYEYFAAHVCRTDLAANGEKNIPDVRGWFSSQYLAAIPEADVLASPPPARHPAGTDAAWLNSPEKTVVIYRDHQTIAGLSRAGLFTKEAIVSAGIPVLDLDFSFGRGRMREEYTHNRKTRRWSRSSLHILNLNPEYVPECLMAHFSCMDASARLIGQFYWELSDIASMHECGLSMVDEIWVASEYLKDVYQRRVSVPVHVMGQAIELHLPDSSFSRPAFDLPEDAYIFLVSFDAGSVIERKNPLAAVRAFQKAFPAGSERATLVLKTRNLAGMYSENDRIHWRRVMQAASTDPRIRIIEKTMSAEELKGLHAVSDCYVSLHRSEGFGYGPAEAMALGKPVVTTAYSGVADFCTSETAFPVNYVLHPVPQGAYPYMDEFRQYYWADPDVNHAARYMRMLFEDPHVGQEIGQRGREFMAEHYSVKSLRGRYIRRLAELGWS